MSRLLSEKAFVFSLDAALAVLILFIVFFLSNYFLFESEPLGWQRFGLAREMGDVFSLLDKAGTLQAMNLSDIASGVNAFLPAGVGKRVEVKTYSAGTGFVLDESLVFGDAVPADGRDVLKGRHLFLTFSDNRVSRYGVAEYWVWWE